MTAHVKRIETVEKDLKALANSSATHEELSRQRAEAKKLYDGLHIGAPLLHRFVNSKLTRYDRTAGCEDTSLGSSYVVLLAFTVFITYPDLRTRYSSTIPEGPKCCTRVTVHKLE